MTRNTINNLIGFYDIRNMILCENQGRDDLIFTKDLPCGIKIHVYNNFYFYLDFNDASILRTSEDLNLEEESVNIHYQKEMINALNACIDISKENLISDDKVTKTDLIKRVLFINDIDQYFLPNNITSVPCSLSIYLNSCADFSTEMYKLACKSKYHKLPCPSGIMHSAIRDGICLFAKLLGDDSKLISGKFNISLFNILSNFWKVRFFQLHDLRYEAVILIRSIYETMVRRSIDDKKPTEKDYKKYCENIPLSSNFKDFKDIRDNAVHEMKVTQNPEYLSSLNDYVNDVIRLFNRDTNLDISNINK